MAKVALTIIIINIFFALLLIPWVTDKDVAGLPQKTVDRFISLFYFGITSFTTTGYGDIHASSNRMKLLITTYMVLVFSMTVSFLFDF
uniref:Potassium channel domain-containing protein n=1 Tax=viral metagenome TaxID=1070528 RepID=A0A6C0AQL0_9ZZZZ